MNEGDNLGENMIRWYTQFWIRRRINIGGPLLNRCKQTVGTPKTAIFSHNPVHWLHHCTFSIVAPELVLVLIWDLLTVTTAVFLWSWVQLWVYDHLQYLFTTLIPVLIFVFIKHAALFTCTKFLQSFTILIRSELFTWVR